MSEQRIGTTVAGYRIESLLGRGGMSVVYLAEHLALGRKVALKVLAADLAADERFRERFVRESRLAASLEHPNIIPIYEAGEADGQLFIAMRLVRGTDLKALIGRAGRLDPEQAVSILSQVARALDAAHAEGLVHRDVKPGNILIAPPAGAGSSEHVYLSDFGLTKRTTSDSGITATGQFVGTLDYAAPEQFEGKRLDGRTDVYSLGCVLFECVTGEIPYQRDREAALMYAHLMAPVPRATDVNPGLSPGLDDVIARAMAKSPDDRFPTAGEMASEARSVIGAPSEDRPATVTASESPPGTDPTAAVRSAGVAPTEAHQQPAPPAGPRPSRFGRRAWVVGVAAVLAVALLVVGIVALTGGGKTPAPGSTGSPTDGPVAGQGTTLVRIDPATNRVARTIGVGRGPSAVAIGHGSVWVANTDDDSVTRVNPTTGQVQATIKVGNSPRGIAAVDGIAGVWVITLNGLWGIDPLTDDVDATIRLPQVPTAVAVGGDAVWVTTGRPFEPGPGLFRIDPVTKALVRGIVGGGGVEVLRDVEYGEGVVWVLEPAGVGNPGAIVRVDPATEDTHRVRLGTGTPVDLSVGEGSVWALFSNGTVSRIDPGTVQTVARIGTENGATAIAVGRGSVWVVNPLKGTLTRIDPESNSVAAVIAVGKGTGVAADQSGVWVTR